MAKKRVKNRRCKSCEMGIKLPVIRGKRLPEGCPLCTQQCLTDRR